MFRDKLKTKVLSYKLLLLNQVVKDIDISGPIIGNIKQEFIYDEYVSFLNDTRSASRKSCNITKSILSLMELNSHSIVKITTSYLDIGDAISIELILFNNGYHSLYNAPFLDFNEYSTIYPKNSDDVVYKYKSINSSDKLNYK